MGFPRLSWIAKVAQALTKSTVAALLVVIVMLVGPAKAHEMSPSIMDAEVGPETLTLTIIVQAEAMVAGVDLSSITNTENSPQAGIYDGLRALSPQDFEARFRASWGTMAGRFRLAAGETDLNAELVSVSTSEAMSDDLPRQTRLVVISALPPDGSDVTVGWAPEFGPIIIRQVVGALPEGEEAYSAFLGAGQLSAPMPREGTTQITGLASFVDYVWLGFTHILPKGLDHILFVLGLFFFSVRIRPLLAQVTSFTVAHTLTLALATLGIVSVPSWIVEPLIALSIAYVAIENVIQPKLTNTRLVVVFGFGLLHGVGFASVLGDIGLSPGHFIASLIAFNVGVELGQLTIITVAFFAIAVWFSQKEWYRTRVVIPISVGIGAMGLWWAVERVIL